MTYNALMLELGVKALLAYLLGSLIGSLIVGQLRGGVDIRTLGSGNPGGTNALRTQGAAFAIWVILIDATIKSLKDNKPPPGHIPSLVAALAPAVKASAQQSGNALDNAIRQNVIDNVARLKSAAPILNAAVEQKKLKVVGGIYRLATGKVELVS